MTEFDRRKKALPRWTGVLAGLVLLVGVVCGAFHHHARPDASHPCAICSLGHAPATTVVVVTDAAPEVRHEPIALPALDAPRTIRVAGPSTRAPPA